MEIEEYPLEDKIFNLFTKYHHIITKNFITLLNENLKPNIQDELEFEALLKAFQVIWDNFLDYWKLKNINVYTDYNTKVAKNIAFSDISFENFIRGMDCLQKSYVDILVKDLDVSLVGQCLILVNNLYCKTISNTTLEYFNAKDTTLTALVKLSELRDDVTGNHNHRSREYAVLLAKELNLLDGFIMNMSKASLLHDIGKIGIKDEILLKPGKLTDQEFDEMKKHTLIGAKTINNVIIVDHSIHDYLYMAIDIALCHHEKYDGSGYPNKLAGDEIPLPARIFAIADAYDVITSDRPYKRALDHEEAVKRIVADSGKHFDPYIVDVFLRIQDKFKLINDKYKSISTSANP
ncbi:MAG: HD-GYP domain-containing protein [Bacillota bacterium]|nr:HD-GYP domain-containing protein [Bacillota bacterium]